MIPYQEYAIKILAPEEYAVCRAAGCQTEGEFALFVENDRGESVRKFDLLCPKHLLLNIITVVLEGAETS